MPPFLPVFGRTLAKRALAHWFLIYVAIQVYWLSGCIGRNYEFLWDQDGVEVWAEFLLVFVFYGIWVAIMVYFYRLSKTYSWVLSIFSVGLAAPLWAQISWSTSNISYSVVFFSGSVSAFVALSVYLWLGILASVQSVGLSMMLLQVILFLIFRLLPEFMSRLLLRSHKLLEYQCIF
jgi:alpha-1,3-glucan synthase